MRCAHTPGNLSAGFFLSDLAGYTADDKRESLYRTLLQHGWPDGYDGYMRALNEPQSPRPGRGAQASAKSIPVSRPKLGGVQEDDDPSREGDEEGLIYPSPPSHIRSSPQYRRRPALEEGPIPASAYQDEVISKLERSIHDLHSAVKEQASVLRHLSPPPRHSRAPRLHSATGGEYSDDSEGVDSGDGKARQPRVRAMPNPARPLTPTPAQACSSPRPRPTPSPAAPRPRAAACERSPLSREGALPPLAQRLSG